jgi:hypothetical protein
MDRHALVEWIRHNGSSFVDQFLPVGALAELESVIRDCRHEVDKDAFLMFASIRALLCKSGMTSCESEREAGQIMALLKT